MQGCLNNCLKTILIVAIIPISLAILIPFALFPKSPKWPYIVAVIFIGILSTMVEIISWGSDLGVSGGEVYIKLSFLLIALYFFAWLLNGFIGLIDKLFFTSPGRGHTKVDHVENLLLYTNKHPESAPQMKSETLIHSLRAFFSPQATPGTNGINNTFDYMDGHEFEYFIADLLKKSGYTAEVTVGSGDKGVDIVASRKGIRYAIQVKRYSSPVSRSAVSDAVAGRIYYKCHKAMVVTNSYFTKPAIHFANEVECALIDREKLLDWIENTC